MRIYLSLIVTAILLSFSTAYFALNLQKEHLATAEEIQEIRELEAEFQNQSVSNERILESCDSRVQALQSWGNDRLECPELL